MTHLYPRGDLKYRNTIQEREKGQQNSTAGERHTGRERRIMCSGNERTINTQTHTHAHTQLQKTSVGSPVSLISLLLTVLVVRIRRTRHNPHC